MQQFSLTWQNISVEVSEKKRSFCKTVIQKKIILNNVSGMVKNNSLIAIMGASGAGKTTFLGAISGRLSKRNGIIKVNNTIMSNDNIKNMSGYVHQQDIFTENLTVLEHLRFMAALRLSNKVEENRYLIIKKLLSELGLEGQSNVFIKHLSGGEKRRLSLAGELLSNPYILFCDEPTTGLDSYSAITVIQKLQTIATLGKIVLTTIHQPSSQLFHCFDEIIFLDEGKLVFQGTKEETKIFFESINLYCPPNYNPAEFYIKCITQEDTSKICDIFKRYSDKLKKSSQNDSHFDNISLERVFKNNFFYELKWLIWRSLINMKRNKNVHLGQYTLVTVELLVVASIFASVQVSDKDGAQNIEGVLSFITAELTYINMYDVIYVFPGEVAVFLREKSLYSSGPYYMSKILSLVPLCILSTIIYVSLLFIILKFLNGFYLWLKMTYLMFLVNMASSGLGLSFSATFSTVEQIDVIMGPLEIVFLLLSGFLVKISTIPAFIRWIRYISPFYYGFNSLSNLFWRDITEIGNCVGNKTIPCYENGDEVLQNYGIYETYDIVSYNILYLHVLIAVFCLIGFAGILRKKILYSI